MTSNHMLCESKEDTNEKLDTIQFLRGSQKSKIIHKKEGGTKDGKD